MNPYLAGINHVFAAPRQICDNCGQQDAAGSLASDTVPITPLLLDYVMNGTLESMRAEHVGPFLVKYLRWRIVFVSVFLSERCTHAPFFCFIFLFFEDLVEMG